MASATRSSTGRNKKVVRAHSLIVVIGRYLGDRADWGV
jgi:hypothetical protein